MVMKLEEEVQINKTMLKEVGDRIRKTRKKKRYSQSQLSEELMISPSHMSDIENGKTETGLSIFMRITEALQVSADYLLQTNIPEVSRIHNAELAEILSDCTPAESRILVKMLRELKRILRESR